MSNRSYIPGLNLNNAARGSLNVSTVNNPVSSKPILKVKVISPSSSIVIIFFLHCFGYHIITIGLISRYCCWNEQAPLAIILLWEFGAYISATDNSPLYIKRVFKTTMAQRDRCLWPDIFQHFLFLSRSAHLLRP